MPTSESAQQNLLPSPTDIAYRIADGSAGHIIPDRDGHWNEPYKLWVHPELRQHLTPGERQFGESAIPLALAYGAIYERQKHDFQSGSVWPANFFDQGGLFGGGGASRLLETYDQHPDIADPYAHVRLNGDTYEVIPYSIEYAEPLQEVVRTIDTMLAVNSPSSIAMRPYLEALRQVYTNDGNRASDRQLMREVDRAWVLTDPDTDLLLIAEPTENYLDPLQKLWENDDDVSEWSDDVTKETGLAPYKNAFEFRLLKKAVSVISNADVQLLRTTTRALFKGDDDVDVPASLEFRILLMASGYGAHPSKVAKNFPNDERLRQSSEYGYKNILYVNMIDGSLTHDCLPALRFAFGDNFVDKFTHEQLLRGATLRVASHEESHPYRRHNSNTVLEELKATVNGLVALDEAGSFENDYEPAIAAMMGGMMFTHRRVIKNSPGNEGADKATFAQDQAYETGNTILINYLASRGVFVEKEGKFVDIDITKVKASMVDLAEIIEEVRTNTRSGSDVMRQLGDASIWDKFNIMPLDTQDK